MKVIQKMSFDFKADPKWKEHFEEKKKYEVWEFFFGLKIMLAVYSIIGLLSLIVIVIAHFID